MKSQLTNKRDVENFEKDKRHKRKQISSPPLKKKRVVIQVYSNYTSQYLPLSNYCAGTVLSPTRPFLFVQIFIALLQNSTQTTNRLIVCLARDLNQPITYTLQMKGNSLNLIGTTWESFRASQAEKERNRLVVRIYCR